MLKRLQLMSLLLLMLAVSLPSVAATVQPPEWYRLEATLSAPPKLNEPVELKVTLHALTGDLINTSIRLMLPDSWTADAETKTIANLSEGKKGQLSYTITPKSYLSHASIVVEAAIRVPHQAIIARAHQETPASAEAMSQNIASWPKISKRYVDVPFALTEYESFYPLSGGMWLNYDSRLQPTKGFAGPVYYKDPMVSIHQAQTDIEMFEKLKQYLAVDPDIERQLAVSGVDLSSKRFDQINGFYVLAVNAFEGADFDAAMSFIRQFEQESEGLDSTSAEILTIAAGNLKGMTYWAQGQKRLAEDALKKTFYLNRRHPLQRYTLRNIGLLMLSNGDKDTAASMHQLALQLSHGYSLLDKEYQALRSN